MLSSYDIEDILPCPIKIKICCDVKDFKRVVQDSFIRLLEEHNRNYDTKIEYIARYYVALEENVLPCSEFEIYVGKKLVHKGEGPDFYYEGSEKNESFYKSIVLITEGVLNTWHDEIIEVQKENSIKLEQLRFEGYDELLFKYYSIRSDKRAFLYLKKLAMRYPHSDYMDKLKSVYRAGRSGWHRINHDMYLKLARTRYNHDYF